MSATGKIVAGATVLGSGIAGSLLGAGRMGRNIDSLNARVRDDLHALATDGTLPYADPPMSVTPRPQRNFFLVHLAGAVIGAAIVGLATALVCYLALVSTHVEASGADKVGGTLLLTLICATFGAVIPGLFPIGGLLWWREGQRRVDDATRDDVAAYFHERAAVGLCLREGRIDPRQAASALSTYLVADPTQMEMNQFGGADADTYPPADVGGGAGWVGSR